MSRVISEHKELRKLIAMKLQPHSEISLTRGQEDGSAGKVLAAQRVLQS